MFYGLLFEVRAFIARIMMLNRTFLENIFLFLRVFFATLTNSLVPEMPHEDSYEFRTHIHYIHVIVNKCDKYKLSV